MIEGRTFQRYPDRSVKVWVGLGVVALVLVGSVPFVFSQRIISEGKRLQDCQERLRIDCDPSLVWLLYGWTPEQTVGTVKGISTESPSAATVLAIESVEPRGFAFEGGWYRADAGTDATFVVKAHGASRVELLLQDKAGAQVVPTKIADMRKTSDTMFESTYRVPSGLLADLVIHAVGTDGSEKEETLHIASN